MDERPILEQTKKKDFWHSKVKMHRNNDYYLQQFRVARNKVTAMIRKRKKEYYTTSIKKIQVIHEQHGVL